MKLYVGQWLPCISHNLRFLIDALIAAAAINTYTSLLNVDSLPGHRFDRAIDFSHLHIVIYNQSTYNLSSHFEDYLSIPLRMI